MMYDKSVIEEALKKLEFKNNSSTQRWAKLFNKLSNSKQVYLLAYMEVAQSEFIIDSMKELKSNIKLYKIGKLRAKEHRVMYYKLKEEYPDKSNDEIVNMLVADYVEKKKKSKLNK